jgi:hypothetical protein
MYPFMSFPDNTEITHSEMQSDGTVRVYVETPDEKDGFHNAWCILPEYRWEKKIVVIHLKKFQNFRKSLRQLLT